MLQDLQGLFGSGHGNGLHPALLRDGCTGLADRLLVIHNKKVHGDNLAADCCFFAHGGHSENLRLGGSSASNVPFQENRRNLFINQYLSLITTLLASLSLELQSRFSRPRCPNLGKRERYDRPKRVLKNEAGPSKLSRRARLFDLVWFSVPLPEVTSYRRRCCSSASTWPLGLGFLRRRWSGRFLPGCFTAAPAEQRQGVLGTEGEASNGLFTGGAESDVDAAGGGQAHGQQGFQELLLLRRGEGRLLFQGRFH